MKTVKKPSYKALSLIFFILSTGTAYLSAQSILMATVRFTKNSTVVPINVYSGGTKIATNIHEISSMTKVTFEIPKAINQNRFYLLITSTNVGGKIKDPADNMFQQNTLDYPMINIAAPYKFYVLDLIPQTNGTNTTENIDKTIATTQTYIADIKEETLPETGQLPDRTITITADPLWIVNITGGPQAECTITLDNSKADTESEEAFEDELIKLELAAIDSNTLHAQTRRTIITAGRCTRIMDSLT